MRTRLGWAALAALLLLLALNDRFQLLGRLTLCLRDYARVEGWYEARQSVQTEFALAVAATTVVGAFLAGWGLRGTGALLKVAVLTALAVIAALVLNAASIHEVDRLMRLSLLGHGPGWWLELLSACLISLCALASIKRYSIRSDCIKESVDDKEKS